MGVQALRALLVVAGSMTAMLAIPGLASATRYAEPNGDGPAASCPEADPCALGDAVDHTFTTEGERVVLAPGIYTREAQLTLRNDVTVGPESGAPRPTLISSASTAIGTTDNSSGVQDMNIWTIADGARGFFSLTRVERVHSISFGDDSNPCRASDGLESSICEARGHDSTALLSAFNSCTFPGVLTHELEGITAVATHTSSTALGVEVLNASSNCGIDLTGRNLLLDSPGPDVRVRTDSKGFESASATLESSRFADVVVEGTDASATPAGEGANITATPELTDGLRQLPGSPTIDAGVADPGLPTQDVDREARVQGAAPDIGADEIDNVRPTVELTRTPGPVTRTRGRFKRVRIAFEGSDEELQTRRATPHGALLYECRVDRGDWEVCASPFKARLSSARRRGKAHVIRVRATDEAGNVSRPARWRGRIKRTR